MRKLRSASWKHSSLQGCVAQAEWANHREGEGPVADCSSCSRAQGPVGIASSDNTAGVPEAFLALASAADVKTVDATRGIELFLGCKDVEAAEQVRGLGDRAGFTAIARACVWGLCAVRAP